MSGEIAVGRWTHLVFTYDNVSGVQAVYVNGRLMRSIDRDDNIDIASNIDPVIISDLGGAFPGLIDEVVIYGRGLP